MMRDLYDMFQKFYCLRPVIAMIEDGIQTRSHQKKGIRKLESIASNNTADFKPILLVDDNPVNQKVGVALLENMGFQVKVAGNGHEAVEAISKEKFSVILMDCQMPVMDGFEASATIRKLEALSGSYTPIIAVTALAMAGDRDRCIAVGMDDYVSKPMDISLLKLKLNHWLNSEVVYQSQKLARKTMLADSEAVSVPPIDLAELEDFYSEEQLDDLLEFFLKHTDDMVTRVQFFMKERSAKAIAGLAHEIRSACASVGAKQLARVCLYLEQSAGQQDWKEAEDSFRQLQLAFNTLKSFIRSNTTSRQLSA